MAERDPNLLGVLTGQVPVGERIEKAKAAVCETCGEPNDHEHSGSE